MVERRYEAMKDSTLLRAMEEELQRYAYCPQSPCPTYPPMHLWTCREERLPPPPPRPPASASMGYGVQPAYGAHGGGRGYDHDDPGPMSADFPE